MTEPLETQVTEKPESVLIENLGNLKSLFEEATPALVDAQTSPDKIFTHISDKLLHDDFFKNNWTLTKFINLLDKNNTGVTIAFRKNSEGKIQLKTGLILSKNSQGETPQKNYDYFIVLEILITQAGLHRNQDDHPSSGPVAGIEYSFYEHFKELKPVTIQWLRDWAKRNPEGVIELEPMIEEMTSDY